MPVSASSAKRGLPVMINLDVTSKEEAEFDKSKYAKMSLDVSFFQELGEGGWKVGFNFSQHYGNWFITATSRDVVEYDTPVCFITRGADFEREFRFLAWCLASLDKDFGPAQRCYRDVMSKLKK